MYLPGVESEMELVESPASPDVAPRGAVLVAVPELASVAEPGAASTAFSGLRLKRAVDVVGAVFLLLLAAPLIVIAAVAVRLDSRGPAFFAQVRVGRDGRRFRLLKLRTMVTDAEELADALRPLSRDPHWLALDHDPRITRVGRILRRLSLDELPQLWNVICGEMSLVGPRPLPAGEDRNVPSWARSRTAVPPGITGLWQVSGRNQLSFAEMVALDEQYVTAWSLRRDLRLLVATVPTVLGGRGAL